MFRPEGKALLALQAGLQLLDNLIDGETRGPLAGREIPL
jgi:hypothetical protein